MFSELRLKRKTLSTESFVTLAGKERLKEAPLRLSIPAYDTEDLQRKAGLGSNKN